MADHSPAHLSAPDPERHRRGSKRSLRMELYNSKPCITYNDLTQIMSYECVKKLSTRGKIEQVRRGCNGTPALFAVESLPAKYKTEVYRRYPDLQERADSKPFIDTIIPDGAALNFFELFELPDGRHLDPAKQLEYSNNAAILNTYRTMIERANSARAKQGKNRLNKQDFWRRAVAALPQLADRYPNSLPTHPARLQEKFNEYVRKGYTCLISGKFQNRNAAKVDTDIKESILLQLIADPRNLSNTQVCELYNILAKTQQWHEITTKPIEALKQKFDLLTAGGRLGETRFRNQKTMQVKRMRPTLPLLYWTLDGWTAELLYQKSVVNKHGHNVTTYTNRLTLVVVLDPCLNYPVGYAIGETENPELIREALRNAANHTAELFGSRYRTNQIQSDNYGRGALKPTYQVMGETYTPARAHNAKAKVIEPYFNHLNRTYCQLCKNWGGFGITSNKNLQPNSEFLNKNRHSFPDEAGCRAQLTEIMERERAAKRDEYIALFGKLPADRRLPLSDEQYLLNFGAETGHRNAIEGQGLCPKIDGVKRFYDSFDPRFREYSHVRWTVKYDPDNIDRVLAVSEDGTLRFMLESKYVQPMALAERKEGDSAQLARVDQFNKQLVGGLTERLAISHGKVLEFFNDNPQLDVATRLLLCDSKGQNKEHKQTRRLGARKAVDVEYTEVETDYKVAKTARIEVPIGEEDNYALY